MFASMFGIKRSSTQRRLAAAAVCAAGIGLVSAPVRAHELGTTRVSVLFPEGRTYDIEIVTDASALVEKLEASAGGSLPADATAAQLQALLPGREEIFRRRVKVVFDEAEVRPTIAYAVTPAVDASSAIVATIRLTGEIPRGARVFAWTFAWTFTTYAMTVGSAAADNPPIQWLEGNQTSAPFDVTSVPRIDRRGTAWRYLTLGVARIVPGGLDHMLFVICICLLGGRARSVLWQVGAFTAAHSIMLALGMGGIVAVQPKIVEPLIALSIAYVALDNIFLADLRSWRIALVFAFGLLHGMSFAAALKDVALPRSEFLTALLTFNIGVEAGQVAVIGAAFVLVGWHCANRDWYRHHIVVPVSALIACTAVCWTIGRLSF